MRRWDIPRICLGAQPSAKTNQAAKQRISCVFDYVMTEPPNAPADVPNEKGKRNADRQTSSKSTSVLCKSGQSLLASFATPSAVSGSLSAATTSANQQKTSPTTSSRANLHYPGDIPGAINTSSSTSTAPLAPVFKSFSAANVSSSDAQRQFEEFAGLSTSRSAANISSDVFYESPTPSAAYLDENDGDAVLAILSTSSHGSEAIYSPTPSTHHATAPTNSQSGYNMILADIAVVEDPVEYLLTTCNYTEEVWGDDWAELKRAKQELTAGNKINAQRRVVGIIGRFRARL
ncbi:hypothetical protein V1508DRAFT_427165 [Lipomyces doorenjongii]|uniref:uncharacterized protein n=1 Tax=Lipomyces doorenjongii TaxID=383834 RepID=UPI0034CD38C3